MKTYFLLRDNKETGPFDLNELQAQKLKPFDLIWIDNESKGWSYPDEITELKGFISNNETVDNIPEKRQQSNHGKPRIFVAFPHQYSVANNTYSTTNSDHKVVQLETKYSKPLDELKEMYVAHINHKKSFFKSTIQRPNALWLVGLFGSLLFGAFTIKKIVDGLDEDFHKPSVAAASIIPVEEYQQRPTINTPQATEAIAIDTVLEKPKTVKKINLTKMVSIEENDFTVGVFGGINNLKLTLHNRSPYELDNVLVTVEYLKPNGDVINEEKLEVISINPNNSKTISVPPSKRGVDVRAKVTKVASKKYKAALLQL